MDENEIFRTVLIILALSFGGGYLWVNREDALPEAFTKTKALKDPRKISLILGLGLLGIAAACVPFLFTKYLGAEWATVLSLLILAGFLVPLTIYERREIKK